MPASKRLRQFASQFTGRIRLFNLNRQVLLHARPDPMQKPLVFFNASTRIYGLSQNAAFSLLTAAGLRLAGIPIVHFVCQAGMSHCVLGVNRNVAGVPHGAAYGDDPHTPPPCKACMRQSKRIYSGAVVYPFKFSPDAALAQAIASLSVPELTRFEYSTIPLETIPLGHLVLPALRWALRRHTLLDDDATRYLLRQYILSAYNIAQQFAACLEQVQPAAVVIFNGIMYPEAAACWVARQHGIRTITQEVGFQPFSAFFSDDQATAYPIHIPEDFELNAEQNARLDAYLEKRFQGKFSMAGIQFWPEMRRLDENFMEKASHFGAIVPIFTNVIYDTSQVHANQVFPHMFAWLDQLLEIIQDARFQHPDTLFVIRAHPDELRPGSAKLSQETVRAWVDQHHLKDLPNVVFIDSQEYISSYDLIQRSKFVIVYNSSIGMEAALMGKAVLCGGKARYTQYPIVFTPPTPQAHREMAEQFLSTASVVLPPEFQRNARRFQYYQLYRASLSFESFLENEPAPLHSAAFVRLRSFAWQKLLPQNSPTIHTILEGLNTPPSPTSFLLPDHVPAEQPT